MTEHGDNSLSQRANAARTHQLLVYFYIFYAALCLITGALAGVTYLALAGANYIVAKGARGNEIWAKPASLAMGVLLLVFAVISFLTRPSIQGLIDAGHVGIAFGASLAVFLAVVEVIAGIYILLNGNWQQPVPPNEKPDSDMQP